MEKKEKKKKKGRYQEGGSGMERTHEISIEWWFQLLVPPFQSISFQLIIPIIDHSGHRLKIGMVPWIFKKQQKKLKSYLRTVCKKPYTKVLIELD